MESVLSADEAEKRSASIKSKIFKGVKKRYATVDGWVTRGLIYAETGIKIAVGMLACRWFEKC